VEKSCYPNINFAVNTVFHERKTRILFEMVKELRFMLNGILSGSKLLV